MSVAPLFRYSRSARRLPLLCVFAAFALAPAVSFAQNDLRSTFPGNRVGGGTRAQCSARLLVHLVPKTSVYAPDSTLQIGLLEGHTATPKPLELNFRPKSGLGSNKTSGVKLMPIELPASTVGITLIKLEALTAPSVWQSFYQCGDETVYPPAVSVLVSDIRPADTRVQKALAELRRHCGGTVITTEFAKDFDLVDVMRQGWPALLPVRCLQ